MFVFPRFLYYISHQFIKQYMCFSNSTISGSHTIKGSAYYPLLIY